MSRDQDQAQADAARREADFKRAQDLGEELARRLGRDPQEGGK